MQSVSDDDVRKRLLEKPRFELAAKGISNLEDVTFCGIIELSSHIVTGVFSRSYCLHCDRYWHYTVVCLSVRRSVWRCAL